MTAMLIGSTHCVTCTHVRSAHYRDGSEQGGGCTGMGLCHCKGFEASIQAPEGSDLAAAAAAEQDADARVELASTARIAAYEAYLRAQDAYDAASQEQLDAIEAAQEARRAHVAAMRAAGVAQTADGYVTRMIEGPLRAYEASAIIADHLVRAS